VLLISPEELGADREQVRLSLEAENIESRPVWKPMHLQPVFRVDTRSAKGKGHGGKKKYPCRVVGESSRGQRTDIGGQKGKQRFQARMVGGKVSEDLFKRGLCLPSGTAMTNSDIDRVIETILRCRQL
jgi:dTDP-4-amino-4,6-dideoxygalactose transaminase